MALSQLNHPWIDSSLAPIYIMRPPEVIEDGVLQALLDEQEKFYTSLTHDYASIAIVDHVTNFNSKQRALVAATEKKFRAVAIKHNKGQAYVLSTAIGRGMLQAMHWVSPPAYPYKIFAKRADALAWVRSQLGIREA